MLLGRYFLKRRSAFLVSTRKHFDRKTTKVKFHQLPSYQKSSVFISYENILYRILKFDLKGFFLLKI